MRKELLLIPLLAGTCALTGCINSHRAWTRQPPTTAYPVGEVIVTEEPPVARREVVGVPPDSSHVWVEGYWSYTDRKWVWIPGHWDLRPRPSAVWVPGYWTKAGDGRWVWTPGRWE